MPFFSPDMVWTREFDLPVNAAGLNTVKRTGSAQSVV
jgi:hypothetical protein